MIKNNKGFSLIEVIVVIIIIAILVVIWGFSGGDHYRIALLNEGQMLVEKVIAQEKIYKARRSNFFVINSPVERSPDINIDTKQNKYFKTFTVKTAAGGAALTVEAFADKSLIPGSKNNVTVRGVYDISLTSNTVVFHEFGL